MPWTATQRGCFMRACALAGWTDPQRYIVMRHCGCPADGRTRQPSLSNPRNDNQAFVRCMAVAERHAAGLGAGVNPPRGQTSWSDAARRTNARVIHLIREIADELTRRIPSKFDPDFLRGFVARQTRNDSGVTLAPPPKSLEECDEGQLYRILEGLKAWGGREMIDRGLRPATFRVPASAVAAA